MIKKITIFLLLITLVINTHISVSFADDYGGSANECDSTGGDNCEYNAYIGDNCGDRFKIGAIKLNQPCEVGFHGCLLEGCTYRGVQSGAQIPNFYACVPDQVTTTPPVTCIPVIQKLCPDQQTCVIDVPWATCPGDTQTPPDTGTVNTVPACGDATRNGQVSIFWFNLDSISECATITGYKIERWEVDSSGNIITSTHKDLATVANINTYVDRTVETGKSYKYQVTAITSGCNTPAPSKGSNKVTIQTCPSIPPQTPSDPQPPVSNPPASNPPTGKYVCKQIVQPVTSGGRQLQLQTLKCEYQ